MAVGGCVPLHPARALLAPCSLPTKVNAALYRIAADLAGVVLTRPEIEVAVKAVKAEIVDHERHDHSVPAAIPAPAKGCTLQ